MPPELSRALPVQLRCALQPAEGLSQMVSRAGPVVRRVVAVWADPDGGALQGLPPCGRCREFLRVLSQQNLDAIVHLGPDHRMTLRELLPVHGWHAEQV